MDNSWCAVAVSGRPVVNYSLALNYAVNRWLGVDPSRTSGYHVANIAIHLLCGALLFGIIRRTMRGGRIPDDWASVADPIAGAATALWLLHPIQTETVDYLIQRTELLVSACYLATLYAAIRAWDAKSQRAVAGWCITAVGACLAGMASKEVMVTAPVTVLLYDRAFRATSWRELLSAVSTRNRI